MAGVGDFELEDEVIHVRDKLDEGGGVGLDFLQQGVAVHDLAARRVHDAGVGSDAATAIDPLVGRYPFREHE